jgi:hypothetical protein
MEYIDPTYFLFCVLSLIWVMERSGRLFSGLDQIQECLYLDLDLFLLQESSTVLLEVCIISLAASPDPATSIIPFLRLSMRLLQTIPGGLASRYSIPLFQVLIASSLL